MKRLQRLALTVPALAFAAGGAAIAGALAAAPGAAAMPAALPCGTVITASTTLGANIGPCPGNGLVIGASGITLDLGGHTITGSHQSFPPSSEQVGVLLDKVSNVTVEHGTVDYFDAGVAINGGSNNTITDIFAHDNISRDVLVAKGVVSRTNVGDQTPCHYGDGITTFQSSSNTISNNRVVHNGPFSGISLVQSSDSNTVTSNTVANNDIVNRTTTGQGTLCGAGALSDPETGATGPMTAGRPVQDIGIRVEGPSDTGNQVTANQVTRSALYGIAIHSYPCNVRIGLNASPNVGNTISGNTVSGTGDTTHTLDPTASGIGILRQGPVTRVCVSNGNTITGNTSSGNWEYGIFLGGPEYVQAPGAPSEGTNATNLVSGNSLTGNHVDGLHVSDGALNDQLTGNSASGNARFDLADLNPGCDNNSWLGDSAITVNQPCVTASPTTTGTVKGVFATGASGSSGAKTLSVTWSEDVTVTNPSGFTVYNDSSCTSLRGTGQSIASGNGTMVTTISLDAAPGSGTTAYYKVAANSVTGFNVPGNAAVPCSRVRFGA